jgi:photosystem II stability/assembly factor-like uncharacterized protein
MKTKIIPKCAFFFALFLAFVQLSFSQPARDTLAPIWNTIPVPTPSHIRVISFDSSDVMYIGVWGQGIFRSLNLGQNWTEQNNGLTNKFVTSIEFDQNGRIFASTYGGGIFVSTNNGATWSPINSGLPSLKIKALKIKYPDTIFVSVEGYGIYRFVGTGGNKTAVNSGLWFRDVNCLTIGDNGSVVAGTNGGGVYYSNDNGNSWRRSGFADNFKVITSFVKNGFGEIFCGTYQGGVFSSADHGLSWVVFKRKDTLKNVTAVTYYNNAEPIAGTDRIGVLRFDSRATEDWRLTSLRDIGITALGRSRQGILFAATIDGSLFKSTDGGANWSSIISPKNNIKAFYSFNNVLFLSTSSYNLYRSTDYGLSWQDISISNLWVTRFANDSSGRLFAICRSTLAPRGYLLVSTNLGDSWDTVLTKQDTTFTVLANRNNLYFLGLSFQPADPKNPNSPSSDVMRSTDGGTSWTILGIHSQSTQGISAIGFNTNGTVYISLTDSVIKSTNNGNTWSIALNKSANNYRDIAFTRNGTIYVAGDFALLRSTNDGLTWSSKPISAEFQFLRSVIVSKFDQILFSSYYGGLQTSIDNGANWDSTYITFGFLKENIASLLSDNNGFLWIVTNTNIYRGIDPNGLPVPKLFEPPHTSQGIPLSTSFKWSKIPYGDLFEFEISDESDFNNVKERIIFCDTSWTNYYTLSYNTLYFWRVRARLNNALGNWSQTFAFTTIISPPKLISPPNNTGGHPIQPTFVWSKVEDASGYILQVSKTPDFKTLVINKELSRINDTTYADNAKLNYATDYYWRVAAKSGKSQSDWSEVWKFRTKVQAPKLRSPANTTYGVPLVATLRWDPTEGGSTYEIQIALDENFENKFFDGVSQANDHFDTKLLEYFTKYYWRVRASDEYAPSDWSETWWFITTIQAPELISPSNNSKNLKSPIVLNWSNWEKATQHHIQIATDNNFNNLVVNDSNLTTNSFSFENIKPNTKYYWRARYRVNNYAGLWSETFSFATSIGVPKLLFPPNDTTNMPLYFTFKWEPVEGAEFYEFVLSTNPNFSQNIVFQNDMVTSTQLDISDLSYETTYYWRVRGKTAQGDGNWSETWKFQTQSQPGSVDEFLSTITIYPIPASDYLMIEFPDGNIPNKIEIKDILGKSLAQYTFAKAQGNSIRLDLFDLEKGIYFIILEFEGKRYIQKVIKL